RDPATGSPPVETSPTHHSAPAIQRFEAWFEGEKVMRSVRAIRSRILTPNMSETSLDVRGFHKKSPAAQELLETVGKSFLTGYAYATAAKDVEEAELQLEQIERPFRGFAY